MDISNYRVYKDICLGCLNKKKAFLVHLNLTPLAYCHCSANFSQMT